MKIFISLDMEGLAGITHFRQEDEERERFRQAMHNQLSWVVEGIRSSPHNSQVEEIAVADSHNLGGNLSYDAVSRMDERISLISGSPRPCYMMAGCDESFDAAFLVGYHAGAGVWPANMDHTFSSGTIYNLSVNKRLMNEASVNAAVAGSRGVPVSLVIGDSGLQKQLKEENLLPWASFVTTKEALGRYSAKFRPQKQVKEDTAAAVREALLKNPSSIPVYCPQGPYRLTIEFIRSSMADVTEQLTGVTRLDGVTIESNLDSWEAVACMISGCTALARTV